MQIISFSPFSDCKAPWAQDMSATIIITIIIIIIMSQPLFVHYSI